VELSAVAQQFVLHWGEMGSRWGVNRTVAQIHALLYLSPAPLPADEIAQTLGVARSNVSTSLRELQNWGVVKMVHVFEDRREHFESMKDVWEMFRVILRERKRREVDPTVSLLRECIEASDHAGCEDAYTRERVCELLQFLQTMIAWYEQLDRLPTELVTEVMRQTTVAFPAQESAP